MEERKKAEEKYEDTVAEGKEMAVMAQTVTVKRKNLIRVNLGNFPPKSKAKLTCIMFSSLDLNLKQPGKTSRSFRLPLCFVPEYIFGNSGSQSHGSKMQQTNE